MYMCVCICMHVHMYLCMDGMDVCEVRGNCMSNTDSDVRDMYACMHVCVYMYLHLCLCIHMRMYLCMDGMDVVFAAILTAI